MKTNPTMMATRIIVLLLLLTAVPVSARNARLMRYNHRRVAVGDSVSDLLSQFGEPKYKMELGELDDGWRRCKVQLWVYEWFPWRYELRIGKGRILNLRKIRVRRVR